MFPGSAHIETLQLRFRDDATVWTAARQGGFAILTRDDDFHGMSVLYGAPPKVIHLRLGNADTQTVAHVLLECSARIIEFEQDEGTSLLVLP